MHKIRRKKQDFNLLVSPRLPWKACGCWVDLFTVAFGLAKLRCWAMAWICEKHCSMYGRSARSQPQDNNVPMQAAYLRSPADGTISTQLQKNTHITYGCWFVSVVWTSRPVWCFCWLFFKKSFSKPPHLLWPRPRPQEERGIELRLEKVVKRNSGSKRRRPISSSPLCSAKPWWSAGPSFQAVCGNLNETAGSHCLEEELPFVSPSYQLEWVSLPQSYNHMLQPVSPQCSQLHSACTRGEQSGLTFLLSIFLWLSTCCLQATREM